MGTTRLPWVHLKGNAKPPKPSPGNFNFFIQGNDPTLKYIDSEGVIRNAVAGSSGGSGSGGFHTSGVFVPSASTLSFASTNGATAFSVSGINAYNSTPSVENYCFLSDFDHKLDDTSKASKFLLWDSTRNELVFTWTPGTDLVGTFPTRIAIVLIKQTPDGLVMFFTSENSDRDARLHKVYNFRVNFAEEKFEYDRVEFVDLDSSYNYQHYDSEHIYYYLNTPATMQIVNITGKLSFRTVSLTNNPFPNATDRVWLEGDENCLYFTRFGPASDGFKSQFVMARKQNPLQEQVLFNLNDENTGFANKFEIDFVNREVFVTYVNSTGNLGQDNDAINIVKHDLDTGEKLGVLNHTHIINGATGNPFKGRTQNIMMHNRRLYCLTDRNPMLYVIDPYSMTVEYSEYLSGTTDGAITDPEFQIEGGVEETGYARTFPYNLRNNELLFSVQSNTCKLCKINLDTYQVVSVSAITDPINYMTYVTKDPVYPPRQKYVSNSISYTDSDFLYTSSLQENRWRVTRSHLTATTTVAYANVFYNTGQTTQPVTLAAMTGLTYTDF